VEGLQVFEIEAGDAQLGSLRAHIDLVFGKNQGNRELARRWRPEHSPVSQPFKSLMLSW
jgi:hypothetical protein